MPQQLRRTGCSRKNLRMKSGDQIDADPQAESPPLESGHAAPERASAGYNFPVSARITTINSTNPNPPKG